MSKKSHSRTLKLARRLLDEELTIPAPMGVAEWAEARRIMPKGVTAKAGPYTLAATPYARGPQEAFLDPAVQVTVMCWAARMGKTECEMNLTGYTIDHDPAAILWVYPTLDSAKKWSKEFFNPMINASPCFRGKIKEAKSRDADNTMLSKGFPGGRVAAIGANSPSGFRQIQAPRVICEEVDAMENGPEGDPVTLAFKRADNYSDSVQVVSSTPTTKGRSRVWAWLESSDFQQWFCACPACGHRQVWGWKDVKWSDGDPSDAHLECERCGKKLSDAERKESVTGGEWRATKPFNGVRGYWINGINSLFSAKKGFTSRLHQAAAEFLAAKKEGAAALRAWTNTFLSETFEEAAEAAVTPDALTARAEEYEPDALPEGVLLLVASADVQKDRIECAVFGVGRDEETWGIEKKVFDGDPEQDEVWARLDAFLLGEFRREDGVPLKIERAFVDMGYKHQRVLAFCAPRLGRGVYPCRGLNRVGVTVPPILPAKPSRNNRARIPHWNVGVTVAKSAIYDRLALPTPGPRSMHFPKGHGFDPDHFRQLVAEKRRVRYSYGQAYAIFEKDNASVRNEALDLAVYALAALYSLMPVNWEKLAENRDAQRTEPKVETSVAGEAVESLTAPQSPMRRPVRRNFATAW